ncbi:hypothetical protein Glaag_0474 [Glaciecola sp. 4H-3-7+YE-5]|nr:hypothetical protein Glaag_0474 [Glaciecola sp. 4H-3-7+YE-5]
MRYLKRVFYFIANKTAIARLFKTRTKQIPRFHFKEEKEKQQFTTHKLQLKQ